MASYFQHLQRFIPMAPEGASYKITGNKIEFQKWKLRVGFNAREGLVLHTVSYKDNSTVRPILYRASLAEMFIPYGDPRPPFHRKAVFDLGNYGIGFSAGSQIAGQHVIGPVTLIDFFFNNSTGDPINLPGAVSITEEDAGILWKHFQIDAGKEVVVRSHRLVISFIATVGNYDYVFKWLLYQDGSIEFEVALTGIVSTNLLAVGSNPVGHGSIVAPQIDAQHHQHWFATRIDTEIDGNLNSVEISDVKPLFEWAGSKSNPYGNGFTTKVTKLKTASQARTRIDPSAGRIWVIKNPSKIHPYTGSCTGYKLSPGAHPPLLLKPNSPLRPQAAFLEYDTWVLPYKEDQIFPGGFYLNNSGLPEWVKEDPKACVENKDIVIFHNFGLTHIPRVEDYPVMSTEHVGFFLKPYNFFLENAAIDVPPTSIGANVKAEL